MYKIRYVKEIIYGKEDVILKLRSLVQIKVKNKEIKKDNNINEVKK